MIICNVGSFSRSKLFPFLGAYRVHNIVLGIVLAYLVSASAAAATIVEDTIIGAGSSFNGQGIAIADGADGPTTVELVEGGAVEGFEVTENSKLIIDGGTSTFLSGVSDNAQLFFHSGTIGCLEQVCAVLDYDAELTALDSSELHFFGGDFDGVIRLRDTSTLHVYGIDLNMIGGSHVGGTYADGTDFQLAVFNFEAGPKIVLHEIPEPTSVVISASGMLYAVLSLRTRWRSHTR